MSTDSGAPSRASIDLYWLPLGAGGHSVRLNGRVFEAVSARLERRAPRDLYHSALEVRVPKGRFVIEQTPIPDSNGEERGVVAEGAVGSRWAGRFRTERSASRSSTGLPVAAWISAATASPRSRSRATRATVAPWRASPERRRPANPRGGAGDEADAAGHASARTSAMLK